jgi:hypothetical protein
MDRQEKYVGRSAVRGAHEYSALAIWLRMRNWGPKMRAQQEWAGVAWAGVALGDRIRAQRDLPEIGRQRPVGIPGHVAREVLNLIRRVVANEGRASVLRKRGVFAERAD